LVEAATSTRAKITTAEATMTCNSIIGIPTVVLKEIHGDAQELPNKILGCDCSTSQNIREGSLELDILFRIFSRRGYKAAIFRWPKRKSRPITARIKPEAPTTTGAVKTGTSAPVARLPIGMPPRKATL